MLPTKENDRGFFRVLAILELISKCGPLNLEQVAEQSGISRTASYRILNCLKEREWIRAQMGTGAFTLTADFVEQIRRADRTYAEVDKLLPILRSTAKKFHIHFDIAVLEDLISPKIVESNRRKRIEDNNNFFESPFSLVALTTEDPRMRMLVLKSAMDHATEKQKESIRDGQTSLKIRSIGRKGFLDDEPNKAVIVPLSGFGGFSGGLRIASALKNQPRPHVVYEVADLLQSGEVAGIPARTVIQNLNF